MQDEERQVDDDDVVEVLHGLENLTREQAVLAAETLALQLRAQQKVGGYRELNSGQVDHQMEQLVALIGQIRKSLVE